METLTEDPDSRFSPVVLVAPETRSGLSIQMAGNLLPPVITRRSLQQLSQEELNEESCNDLKPLLLNSEKSPAVHCLIIWSTGHLTFWFMGEA